MRTLIFAVSWLVLAGGVVFSAAAVAAPHRSPPRPPLHDRLTDPQPSAPRRPGGLSCCATTDFAANKDATTWCGWESTAAA